ncbi:hypothetical protein BDV12DRAFT_180156 [Aspergillus spectabilis]
MPHIILLGTLDTKLAETLYIHTQLHQLAKHSSTPLEITLIDCGRDQITNEAITISHTSLLSKYASPNTTLPNLSTLPRGEVITFLTTCVSNCVRDILATREVHGIIGTGGSGGTSLIASVMRTSAPIGLPKFIVSTIASGDTSSIIGECDITLMYSVVDIAGLNRVLRGVLSNAAGAIFGMATTYEARLLDARSIPPEEKKIRIGVTMFGVTTPSVDFIRRHLESNYSVEVYVFHATGHGGKAMERLVSEGQLDAILDLTTTEIADFIAGGNMSCEASRLEASLKRGIPNIISLGATDMVNFGPKETVPPRYEGRNLQVHNPSVTLMRTSGEECRMIAEFVVDKIKRFAADQTMVEVWIPAGGVSVMSKVGGVFEDSGADAALFDAVRDGLEGSDVRVVSDKRDVNDEGFAVDIADRLMGMLAPRV